MHAPLLSAIRTANDPYPVEDERAHRVGHRGAVVARPRTVPLRHRVDQAEQQPGGQRRVDVHAQVAVSDGLLDQRRGEPVELAAAGEGLAFAWSVAVHPQQQGDERELRREHREAAPDQVLQPVHGATGKCLGRRRDAEQPVRGPAGAEPQQLLLRGDMVVDRRLRDAQRAGQVSHRGSVVAALVEQPHRGHQDRLQVVPWAPGAAGAPGLASRGYDFAHVDRSSITRRIFPVDRSSVPGSTTFACTVTPMLSFTTRTISAAAASRAPASRASADPGAASTSTVSSSSRSGRVSSSWKCGASPGTRSTISSICVGNTLTPRRMIMSSLRPLIRAIRRNGAYELPGSSRVMSRVRYLMTGIASLVSVVSTSSPGCPSGSTAPSGPTISG